MSHAYLTSAPPLLSPLQSSHPYLCLLLPVCVCRHLSNSASRIRTANKRYKTDTTVVLINEKTFCNNIRLISGDRHNRLGVPISFGDGVSFLESLGIISKTHDDDTVFAEYNGFKVAQAMIDTQRSTGNLADSDSQSDANMDDDSDRTIIDRLITGQLLIDEAEACGSSSADRQWL